MIETDDGVKIHTLDDGEGPVTVLVGGYGMPAEGWTLQQRFLAERRQRVVTIDRRSHGRSERPAGGQSLRRHALDIECVLAQLGLEDVCIVGSSMGASTIWAYVDAVGTGRLRSIVSVDQTPRMVNSDGWSFGLYGLDEVGVETFVAEFPLSIAHLATAPMAPPAEVAELMASAPPFSFDETRELLRDHTVADWRGVVATVDVPVLAVAGRHSPLWPTGSSRWIADAAPDGRYAELDGGHAPFIDCADDFNRVLEDWIR